MKLLYKRGHSPVAAGKNQTMSHLKPSLHFSSQWFINYCWRILCALLTYVRMIGGGIVVGGQPGDVWDSNSGSFVSWLYNIPRETVFRNVMHKMVSKRPSKVLVSDPTNFTFARSVRRIYFLNNHWWSRIKVCISRCRNVVLTIIYLYDCGVENQKMDSTGFGISFVKGNISLFFVT